MKPRAIKILFLLILISSCSQSIESNEDICDHKKEIDSLKSEIEKRNHYLRVMVDRLIQKPIQIDSVLGKTIIEIGKL